MTIAAFNVELALEAGIPAAALAAKIEYLQAHTNRADGFCWRTRDELESEIGLRPGAQRTAIAALEKAGYLETKTAYIGKTNRTCIHYRLTEKYIFAFCGDASPLRAMLTSDIEDGAISGKAPTCGKTTSDFSRSAETVDIASTCGKSTSDFSRCADSTPIASTCGKSTSDFSRCADSASILNCGKSTSDFSRCADSIHRGCVDSTHPSIREYENIIINNNLEDTESIPYGYNARESTEPIPLFPEKGKADETGASNEKRLNPFEEFWAAYPNKRGKTPAQKAFNRAVKSGAEPEKIIDGARALAEETSRKGTEKRYIPYPTTFLEDELWLDADEMRAQAKEGHNYGPWMETQNHGDHNYGPWMGSGT